MKRSRVDVKCSCCGAALQVAPSTARSRKRHYCNIDCERKVLATTPHMRKKPPVHVNCSACGAALEVQPWKAKTRSRHFCNKACYLQAHASAPRTCPTCQIDFVPASYSKSAKYCSRSCVPMHGEANPNHGKRHPGMWQMPAERRLAMSEQRVGAGNPRWSGGSPANGKFQHQQFVRSWALGNLPRACAVCGSADVDLHHIAPRRYFQPRRLAHFAENLILLCRAHNIEAHWGVDAAMQARQLRDLPFADRLPPAILEALERGGFVSAPLPGCDYSPLGNLVEAVIRQAPPKRRRG